MKLNSRLFILKILGILGILVQTIYSQSNNMNIQELMSAYQGRSGGAQQPSAAEMLYIQQTVGQERASGRASLLQKRGDSTNLFLNTDSLLGSPMLLGDTISYAMVIDTIAIDSLYFYEDIEEIRQITKDGKRRVVLTQKKSA